MLAHNGYTIVTFDLYSHGRSSQLDNKKNPHNKDLFLSQVHDVIHHEDLPIKNSKKIILHGFSTGGYLCYRYLIRYYVELHGCCQNGHIVKKVVFQSPWDCYIDPCIRMLAQIPGLLSLLKPSAMREITSIPALREILTRMDKEMNFSTCMKNLATFMDNYRDLDDNENKISFLFITGTREPPFCRIAKRIRNVLAKKQKQLAGKTSIKIYFRLCKKASHMTFVEKTDCSIGNFFREQIKQFITDTIKD